MWFSTQTYADAPKFHPENSEKSHTLSDATVTNTLTSLEHREKILRKICYYSITSNITWNMPNETSPKLVRLKNGKALEFFAKNLNLEELKKSNTYLS